MIYHIYGKLNGETRLIDEVYSEQDAIESANRIWRETGESAFIMKFDYRYNKEV